MVVTMQLQVHELAIAFTCTSNKRPVLRNWFSNAEKIKREHVRLLGHAPSFSFPMSLTRAGQGCSLLARALVRLACKGLGFVICLQDGQAVQYNNLHTKTPIHMIRFQNRTLICPSIHLIDIYFHERLTSSLPIQNHVMVSYQHRERICCCH